MVPNDPVLVPAPPITNTTVAPPLVIVLPAASFACSVTVVALPETSDPLPIATVDCAGEITPGVTVKDGIVVVTAAPLIVACIPRAVPAVVAVNVAVYVPFPLSVTALTVPLLFPADVA